jgi:hypothetical protein
MKVLDGSVDMGQTNLGEVLPGLNPNCRHHYIIQKIGSGDMRTSLINPKSASTEYDSQTAVWKDLHSSS